METDNLLILNNLQKENATLYFYELIENLIYSISPRCRERKNIIIRQCKILRGFQRQFSRMNSKGNILNCSQRDYTQENLGTSDCLHDARCEKTPYRPFGVADFPLVK